MTKIPDKLVTAAAEASCTCSLPDGSRTYHRTCEELARRALAAAFAALTDTIGWQDSAGTRYHGATLPLDDCPGWRRIVVLPEIGEDD